MTRKCLTDIQNPFTDRSYHGVLDGVILFFRCRGLPVFCYPLDDDGDARWRRSTRFQYLDRLCGILQPFQTFDEEKLPGLPALDPKSDTKNADFRRLSSAPY